MSNVVFQTFTLAVRAATSCVTQHTMYDMNTLIHTQLKIVFFSPLFVTSLHVRAFVSHAGSSGVVISFPPRRVEG